jgi:alkylhydroperoxidase family enzyme
MIYIHPARGFVMRRFALPLLVLFALACGSVSAQPDKPAPKPAFPALPEDEAWGKLPPRKTPALPEWARVTAGPLPKTTAKMLELDYHHREKNPLGPVLAAQLRWVVADTLGSRYGVAVAEADLERAGLNTSGGERGPKAGEEPKSVQVALAFAKKLTLEGHAITDKEFAELLKHFGPAKTTAIVHTVAYANFHNRVLLGLGVKGESPVAEPLALKFDLDAAKVKAPERPPWDDLKSVKSGGLSVRAEWGDKDFDRLNEILEDQKERKPRMPLPDKSVYEKLTPREQESSKKILWNTVSMGYQPELTRAWFAVLYTFYEEAKVDRVFTNSVFWVVTRTNDCFY